MSCPCLFEMHVAGKKENVEKYIEDVVVRKNRMLAGMYFQNVIDKYTNRETGDYVAVIKGECIASTYYSFCSDYDCLYAEATKSDIVKNHLTNIQKESRKLNLKFDVFSYTPDTSYMGHILVIKGKLKDDEWKKAYSGYETMEKTIELWEVPPEEIEDWYYHPNLGFYFKDGFLWDFSF